MWKLLRFIFVIKFHFIYGKLVGDNICLTEESFLVNVTENYLRNVTVRNYKWCYNVPPRCSYYTVNRINDTRIVERNRTRTFEICCDGFVEKNDKCIPNCSNCEHGKCINGSCLCSPGNTCDVVCNSGGQCASTCNCNSNSTTGSSSTTVEEMGTVETSTDGLSRGVPMIELVPDIFRESKTKNNTSIVSSVAKNNGYVSKKDNSTEFPFDFEENTMAIKKPLLPQTFLGVNITKQSNAESVLETPSTHETTTNPSVIGKSNFNDHNKGFFIPVEIKYDQLENFQSQTKFIHTTPYESNEDHLLGQKVGFTKRHTSPHTSSPFDLLTLVGIGGSIAVILIVALMTINFMRRRMRNNKGTAAVSFIATSIFHQPLPDTPTTENPLYLTPIRYHTEVIETPPFETRILYNLKMPNRPMSDCREYMYDHPPSTGSYRAASVIEPSEVARSTFSEEPIYDEIKYREDIGHIYEEEYQNPKPLSIYINTMERTKL
ncbi:nimrod A isoform X2 [Leptinotarsa decemlineata]|uniref:nimrod A isoform X2 n=1 Tax=Leptinotarsa decemlineata TaxID=7539 RepID=UPI003D307F8B